MNPLTHGIRRLCFLSAWLWGSLAFAGATPKDLPQQEIWYHSGYPGGVVGPRSGISATMGPTKMPVIFEAILRDRLIEPNRIHTDHPGVPGRASIPVPIDLPSLRAVHSDRYIKAILTGEPKSLALSQGLPLWNPRIARGWLLNVGGLAAASRVALEKKTLTANLGHGYHHATMTQGMGFCTLNGLVIVSAKMIREGLARRIMIIDLDHHEGNGTAEMVIGDSSIWNLTIYGSPMGGLPPAANHHGIRVGHEYFTDDIGRDANYLAIISEILPSLLDRHDPDLLIYQAGMDPYDGAGITPQALAIRDAFVFALARSRNKPLTWVLAGGYAELDTLARLHTQTVRMANEVLAQVKPGDRIAHRGSNAYCWSVKNGLLRFPDWKGILRGNFRMSAPDRMAPEQALSWAAARRRILHEHRLPDTEMESIYHALFP